jgi:hypothetical protein
LASVVVVVVVVVVVCVEVEGSEYNRVSMIEE